MQIKKNYILKLESGELVKVRSVSEIIATLDENRTLEGLPFMPEMLQYCGRKFKVLKPIHKIIVEGLGMRHIKNTVLLDGVLCNGKAHEGCQRMCTVLWKEAWLKRVRVHRPDKSSQSLSKTIDSIEGKFPCQSVNLSKATDQLQVSFKESVKKYFYRYRFENRGTLHRICILILYSIMKVKNFLGPNEIDALHGPQATTPTVSLNLQPGELVEIKRKEEILRTLDLRGRNRGLEFINEMQKYCGQQFQVMKRVERIIEEKTGKMRELSNTVTLKNVVCDGSSHGFCPRNCILLWREIWLKRV